MKTTLKVEPGMDRREILATTYQMRNCFKQFADGVASELDVMCYFMHAYAADLCKKGFSVLDVCCGRGLMIPFLRFRGTPPKLYCGVDLKASNATWKNGQDPRRESGVLRDDWGFPVHFVESNVAKMSSAVEKIIPDKFDLIIYTSSIEHMHPTAQQASLKECRSLAHLKTILYLSCPVTPEDQDGYDTRYAAHVYEPKQSELQEWLNKAGWRPEKITGLITSSKQYRKILSGEELEMAETIYSRMPREQALPTIASLYPACATEIAYECVPQSKTLW